MKFNTKVRILEFVLAGIIIDLLENAVTIKLTTGATMTFDMVLIALVVVIPFSIVTELIIDHPKFWPHLFSYFKFAR
jgi:hypothetical protein